MRILTCAAVAAAVALCGCAGIDANISPQDVHLGVSVLDKAICGQIGKTDFCSKKAQKAITSAISAATPPAQ